MMSLLNNDSELKFNALPKSLQLLLKKPIETKEREKVKKYSTVKIASTYAIQLLMFMDGGLNGGICLMMKSLNDGVFSQNVSPSLSKDYLYIIF